MSTYTCCRGPDPATRCAPMEPLVHGLHRTLRDPKSTWSLSIPVVIKKWKENESSTVHLASCFNSIWKLSGGCFAKNGKTTIVRGKFAFVCNLCNRLREERETEKQLGKQLTLTCSTQTLVVRIWFFKSYKNTRKEKERNRIYMRRLTHKKVPGLPQFSQFI